MDDMVTKLLDRLETLTLPQLRQVDQRLHELLDRIEQWQRPDDEAAMSKGSYKWEWVKCGDPTCHCASGERHGPHLYRTGYVAGKDGKRGRHVKRYVRRADWPAGMTPPDRQ